MKRYQLKLLNMLLEFKEELDKNSIKFILIGGSALGAVRHKGFIPWDDDMDIALYRSEFEKMEKILEKVSFKNIEYIFSETTTDAVPYGRIVCSDKKNSQVIDVYPIDNVPDTFIGRNFQYIVSEVYHFTVKQSIPQNRPNLIKYLTKIALKILSSSMKKIMKRNSKNLLLYWNGKETRNIANIYGYKKYFLEIMPKEYIGTPILSEFEGEKFFIPEQWDKYLTHLYGDYMQLPPIEEQVPKHGRGE